jgi:hypothetical protein
MAAIFGDAPGGSEAHSKVSSTKRLLNDILHRCGLATPDGRPLYRYKVSSEEYLRGREILRKTSALLGPGNSNLCAVFALITAEWYRREASSLWRVWSDIGIVPLELSVAERGEIVQTGLDWWGLPLKISPRGREFLLTLALNGGLPSALIVGETGNRVRRFFQAVMRDALETSALTSDFLSNCAEKHSQALPDSYRDETIYELTSELMSELAACRATLPPNQRQANPAGWLDAANPSWRDRLPIHLPDDTAACNRLFNDLLTIEPRAKAGGVGLRRLLRHEKSGTWKPGFLVQADGALAFDALKEYAEGRFRAYFSGTAGQLMSREFAQLYRSETNKSGTFEVISRAIGWQAFIGPVPFAETVAVTLSRDGQTLPAVCWPGGQSRNSNCYVLKPTADDDQLELIGTGSVRSPLPALYVLIPAASSVLGHQGGGAQRVWHDSQQALWRIEGMALVEMLSGERYRVHAGADKIDERRLDLNQSFMPDISIEDNSVLMAEAPLRPRMLGLQTGQDANQRPPRWTKSNREISNRDSFVGLVTIKWEDEEGFLIDRARVCVMPAGFALDGLIDRAGARIRWRSMPGWRIEPIDEQGAVLAVSEASSDSFLCAWPNAPLGHQRLRLSDPDGAGLVVRLRLRSTRTLLVDADGRIRDDSPELSPAELRGATLVVERSTLLDLHLRGAGGARALISRLVESDTPMVRFGDLAQRLLGLSEERGPRIVVQDDRARNICTIRRSQDQPFVQGNRVKFSRQYSDDTIAVARPLIAASEEHPLVKVERELFEVPGQLEGPCLIYCRKGDAVLTRPTLVNMPIPLVRVAGIDAVARLSLEPDGVRQALYIRKLKSIAEDASAGVDISRIVGVVHSLNGLSPRALDITRELPSIPKLLCRLLLAANSEKVDAILGLEHDLPFLWMAQPVDAWRVAAITEWQRAKSELSPIFGSDEAQTQSFALMRQRMDALSERTIWFAGIRDALEFPGDLPTDLSHLAQDHVRLNAEQRGPVATSLIEKSRRLGIPPAIAALNFEHYATLVAPVVLAGVALGQLSMTPDLAASLRDALDIDQSYIAAAFPHCLKKMKP